MRFWWKLDDQWRCLPIEDRLDFDVEGTPLETDDPAMVCAASLLRLVENQTQRAVLITAPDSLVRVNGYRPLGIVVLRDRDVVSIGSQTFHFAERTPTEPEPFPGGDRELCCARCKKVMHPAELAIRCAACGSWHHVRPEKAEEDCCWRHDLRCGQCQRNRDELIWSPEDLDA
jgi:hypothetical protein